jgi:hypothetical protein
MMSPFERSEPQTPFWLSNMQIDELKRVRKWWRFW